MNYLNLVLVFTKSQIIIKIKSRTNSCRLIQHNVLDHNNNNNCYEAILGEKCAWICFDIENMLIDIIMNYFYEVN